MVDVAGATQEGNEHRGRELMQVHATARVVVWQEGKAHLLSPVLPGIDL